MAGRYYAGLDAGTHNTRFFLWDAAGNRAMEPVVKKVHVSETGHGKSMKTQSMLSAERAAIAAIRDGVAQASQAGITADEITGIGISGHMHIDGPFTRQSIAAGSLMKPVASGTMWNSGHNADLFTMLLETPAIRRMILQATLNEPMQRGIFTKMLWRKLFDKPTWDATTSFMTVNDWLVHVLTGEVTFEMSNGVSAIDPRTGKIAQNLFDFFGMQNKLPRIVESYEKAGTIRPEIARATGLSVNTIVAPGGGDQRVGHIGNGIVAPGLVGFNWGWSGVTTAFNSGMKFDPTGRIHAFGPNVPWFMACCMETGHAFDQIAEKLGVRIDDGAFEQLVGQADENSGGVVYWPWAEKTNHPIKATNTAEFWANEAGASPANLASAVVSGSVVEMVLCAKMMQGFGLKFDQGRLGGGGANSDIIAQRFADATQLPISVNKESQVSAFGAAICAMVAAGEYPDLAQACGQVVQRSGNPYEPNAGRKAFFDALGKRYYTDFAGRYPAAMERHNNAEAIAGQQGN